MKFILLAASCFFLISLFLSDVITSLFGWTMSSGNAVFPFIYFWLGVLALFVYLFILHNKIVELNRSTGMAQSRISGLYSSHFCFKKTIKDKHIHMNKVLVALGERVEGMSGRIESLQEAFIDDMLGIDETDQDEDRTISIYPGLVLDGPGLFRLIHVLLIDIKAGTVRINHHSVDDGINVMSTELLTFEEFVDDFIIHHSDIGEDLDVDVNFDREELDFNDNDKYPNLMPNITIEDIIPTQRESTYNAKDSDDAGKEIMKDFRVEELDQEAELYEICRSSIDAALRDITKDRSPKVQNRVINRISTEAVEDILNSMCDLQKESPKEEE